MKKIQLAAFIAAAALMLGSAYAAGLDAPVPPSFNDAPDNIQRPSKLVRKTPRLRKLNLRKT